jgi:phospholipase C
MPAFLKRRAVVLDRRAVVAAAAMAIFGIAIAMPVHRGDADNNTNQPATASPIKHVIVVIGENRSFDHVFATYRPKSGDSILNPLSEGIIGENGAPGHRFGQTTQYTV